MKASVTLAFALALCASAAPIPSLDDAFSAQPIISAREMLIEAIHEKTTSMIKTVQAVTLNEGSHLWILMDSIYY
ncbi:hypothetical protein HDZ31DRAFT_67639 [Schizophyllum fasciatum]